jgi:hypothetical protein
MLGWKELERVPHKGLEGDYEILCHLRERV